MSPPLGSKKYKKVASLSLFNSKISKRHIESIIIDQASRFEAKTRRGNKETSHKQVGEGKRKRNICLPLDENLKIMKKLAH